MECISLSDIVKFSDENVPDTSFADAFNDKLFVQTRGKDGLCFKLRDGERKVLAGIPNDNVIDTEGAGDWTTAAIIYGIVRSGKSFAELNEGGSSSYPNGSSTLCLRESRPSRK